MNSHADDRSWRMQPGQSERVFLVGVEFLAHNHSRRSAAAAAENDPAPVKEVQPSMKDRRQPTSSVPPAARAARNVVDARLHATEVGHSAFSAEESMAELRELATSAGGVISGEVHQRRQRPDSATLIGSGKVLELRAAVACTSPDLVIFDHELTPSQQRNLERALEIRVIDRTQLILDIFARHARTREGQLQVELAQLEYLLPRLAGR